MTPLQKTSKTEWTISYLVFQRKILPSNRRAPQAKILGFYSAIWSICNAKINHFPSQTNLKTSIFSRPPTATEREPQLHLTWYGDAYISKV